MSFWMVPVSFSLGTPAFSAAAIERQQDGRGAVDGETGADLVERDAVEQDLGVGQGVDRHPTRPTSSPYSASSES